MANYTVTLPSGGGTVSNVTLYRDDTLTVNIGTTNRVAWDCAHASVTANVAEHTWTSASSIVFSYAGPNTYSNYAITFNKENDDPDAGYGYGSVSGAGDWLVVQPDTTVSIATYKQSGVTVATNNINPDLSLVVGLSGSSSPTQYRLVTTVNSSNGTLASGSVTGAYTGGTDITVTTAKIPDNQGESTTYKLQARVPLADGGTNTWVDTGDTFTTFNRYTSVPLTPALTYGTHNAVATTATLQAQTAPTGSTTKYQLSPNTADTNQSKNVNRGTQYSYYTYFENSSGAFSKSPIKTETVPYKGSDKAIATIDMYTDGANNAFHWIDDTGSHDFRLTGLGPYDDYRIVVDANSDNGTLTAGTIVNTQTTDGSRTTDIFPLASNEIPVIQGEKAYYRTEARRPTVYGGANIWEDCGADGDSEILRVFDIPLGPFGEPTYGSEIGPTCTATVPSKGAPDAGNVTQYRVDSGAWQTSRVFTVTRNASHTYEYRWYNASSGFNSQSFSAVYLAPAVLPDTAITIEPRQNGSALVFGLISGTSNVTTYLSGLGVYTDYRVLSTTASSNGSVIASKTIAQSDNNGSRTTADLAHSSTDEVPIIEGEQAFFEVEARQPVVNGGNGLWYSVTSGTFTLSQIITSVPSNPSLSYGSAASATANATIAVISPPSGLETQYRRGTGTWSTTRTFAGTRGTSYTYQARFHNPLTTVAPSSTSQTVEVFPYRAPDATIDWELWEDGVQVGFGIVVGTTNIEYRLLNCNGNDDYRIIARDDSTNGTITNGTVAYYSNNDATTTRICPLDSTTEVPQKQGELIYYEAQARSSTAKGGDNIWVTAESLPAWYLLITPPPTPIVYYPLEAGGNNWNIVFDQPTEAPGLTTDYRIDEGAWGLYSGQVAAAGVSHDYDVRFRNVNSGVTSSYSRLTETAPFSATNLSATYTIEQSSVTTTIIDGVSNVKMEISAVGIYEDIRLLCTTTSSNGSVVVGNVPGTNITDGVRSSASLALNGSHLPDINGEEAYYTVQVRKPTSQGGDNIWYTTTGPSSPTLTLEQLVQPAAQAAVTYATTASATADSTITAQSAPTGCETQYRRTIDSFNTSRVDIGTRGTEYSYQVRFRNTTTGNVGAAASTTFTEDFPYLTGNLNPTFSLSEPSGIVEHSDTTNNMFLNILTGGSNTEYRGWATGASTSLGEVGIGSIIGTGSITINNTTEMPADGELITYKIQGRRPVSLGGNNIYQDTGDTFTLERTVPMTFQLGGSTVTTSGNAAINKTGPGYAPVFAVDATASIYAGNFTTITVNEDHDNNGTWADAGWTGTTVGLGTTTPEFDGTALYLTNGLGGNSSNVFKYKGYTVTGDGVETPTAVIDVTFTAETTGVNPAAQSYETTYSVNVTNSLSTFDYVISASGTGDILGGLAMGAQALPSDVISSVVQGNDGTLVFNSLSDGALLAGDTGTYYIWMRRRTVSDDTWYVTSASFDATLRASVVLGTTTISPDHSTGAGTLVTISGSATIASGTITDIYVTDIEGNAPIITETPSGLGTNSASISATFTTVDQNKTYRFKVGAESNLGATDSSNEVVYVSTKTGSTTNPNPGEGLYGLNIYKSSGAKVFDTSSTVPRFIEESNWGVSASTPTQDKTIAGMTNTDDWIVVLLPNIDGEDFAGVTVTKGIGKFTVTGDFSQVSTTVMTGLYWVFKT